MRPRHIFSLMFAGSMLTGLPGWLTAREGKPAVPRELAAPAGSQPTSINPNGVTILPNGRLITPLGKQVKVAPHPYGMVLSPDGKTLVTVNSGTQPFSISIITGLDQPEPQVVQIPPGYKSADTDLKSVFMGAEIAPDNRTLYVSEGNNGKVGLFDLVTHQRISSISLDGTYCGSTYKDSLTSALALTPNGRHLLVLDLALFRLVVVDTQSKEILSSTPMGRMPFGLAVSPDGKRAYVSNVGMFRYSLVPGFDPNDIKHTGLDFPAFGFPSKEATEGATVEGKQIAGLGDPNVSDSNSLFVIDIRNPAQPQVVAKVRTGLPVGEQSVGGSSPGAVVAGKKYVFVSNAAQDSITILDARTNRVKKTVLLEPAESVKGLRGVLPFGIALSPDERRLYVACSGINAVGVLSAPNAKPLGYFPTAWFPARVAISRDNLTLYVANAKGFGAGANAGPGFREGPDGTYIGDITKGVVSIVGLPVYVVLDATKDEDVDLHKMGFDRDNLRADTARVLGNSGFTGGSHASRGANNPIPSLGASSASIKYVVFVVKENRTFDEVFGELHPHSSEFDGNAKLARWGENAKVEEKDEATIENGHVTPNHHALARRFAISDNYYVDSDVSVDGHHWLVGNYPTEVLETGWPAAYGKQLEFRPDNDAPGRLGIGSSHPWPESYLQAGSLWEHLARHHITFRSYGEGLEMAGEYEDAGFMPTGVREATNMPMPQVLFENTSHSYATFNTSISDQYRFGQFEQEFRVRYASGKEPLPQFICIWLPNDHTDQPRPEDGFRYRASYVADNDLALGKLVDLFSHSPYWKDMAIFVTEDDAQGGVDHVDAHRSVLMVISPCARQGHVSHVHTSMMSILKTFDLIFGLPYLNQFDAAATDLSDFFTDQSDFTPYAALPSDPRIFDPAKVREPGLELNARPSAPLDDPATIRREMRLLEKQVE